MSTEMRRYLLLLPAPEEQWAQLPESEAEVGMRNHQRFHERLRERHTVVTAGPLEPSADAVSLRNRGRGEAEVTQGPFTAGEFQVVGFYLVESSDEADLLAAVTEFAEGGDHVELRRLATS